MADELDVEALERTLRDGLDDECRTHCFLAHEASCQASHVALRQLLALAREAQAGRQVVNTVRQQRKRHDAAEQARPYRTLGVCTCDCCRTLGNYDAALDRATAPGEGK